MIETTILLLQQKLQEHFSQTNATATVITDNIAHCDSHDGRMKDKIVLTLLNLEEETTLQQLLPVHDRANHLLPLRFSLLILFSFYYPGNYHLALRRLDNVVQYFNDFPKFTLDDEHPAHLELEIQLTPLNLEEIKNIWTALGIPQLPFLLYKLKVTEIIEA